MKLQVNLPGLNETWEVHDAAEALSLARREAAKRAPLLLRPLINRLDDLSFAREVVKRANQSEGRSDPVPGSAEAFLQWAIDRGYVKVLSS